ncbi:GGDEF domain-containing protein [Campylobacter sp.]|uniref:GGDEF domain-containing protein n=1 Tax=Campylobacter sp. TaxID=205 RepID=UPI002708E919|nr:diguanylate cyclase [Campylobacter sp.]
MIKVNKKKAGNTVTVKDKDSVEFNIYGFSEDVIKELNEENVPSIPKNYSIFFEKMLEKKPDEFKKKMGEIIEIEDEIGRIEDDRQIYVEREIKQSFAQIKSMLQAVALIYKNLGIMKTIIKKRSDSLEANANLLTVQNVFNAFNDDLDKLNTLMNKHIDVIKTNYEEISRVFKVVEEQSIYDPKFDLYNKKFFLKTISSEMKYVQKYGYNSSFMLVKAKDRITDMLGVRDKQIVLKNISRFLLKTSRRSDILAHYGDGIFAMLMKHTDINGAKKACERIADMFYTTTFLIGDEELEIDMEIAVCDLNTTKTVEEVISNTLDSLPNSGRSSQKYTVVEMK